MTRVGSQRHRKKIIRNNKIILPFSHNKAQRKFNFLQFANYEHLVTEGEKELHNLLKLNYQNLFKRQLVTRKDKTFIFSKMFRTHSIGIVLRTGK
jgi:hypothetical protein